ncbi:hypothetical protein AB0G02_37140 [Actinosynnema sp. NPDC023658]|uniref:hypothetical protein n=1 Tax=Actinosynnema sp. NPDC023658 TaxID=3155465 RepID=UPI0033FFE2C2
MPSSFSRFLDEDELVKVRELYLESLAALDEDEEDEDEGAGAEPLVDPPVTDDAAGNRES